jgi:hypothetical protein
MLPWAVIAGWMLFAAAPPQPGGHAQRARLGVELALSGQPARAESVFVSLLSDSPGDARALTDLGNLHLLRGDPETALAFYRRAALKDTVDGGIRLNRAVALLLLDRTEEAGREAAEGRRLAGGIEQAESLLGIRTERDAATGKAAEMSARMQIPLTSPSTGRRTSVSRSEVSAMLGRTQATTAGAPKPAGVAPATAPPATATKAAAAETNAMILYWKY